jgi:MFS family permease
VVLINAAHWLTHFLLLILPTAVLAMTYAGSPFGHSYGAILALATGMFVFYGAGALPQAWLAVRIGRKRLMAVFFFGTSVSLFSAGITSTPLGLALALSAAGLFASIYHPVGTAMLVEAAAEQPGRALGVNGVFGNLGVAMAPVLTALLAVHSWRIAFIGPALVAGLMGLAWVRLNAAGLTATQAVTAGATVPEHAARRAAIILLVIAVVSGLVFNAFTLLIPKLMHERVVSDPAHLPLVGLLAFTVALFGAATQFMLGRRIDRLSLKPLFLRLALVTGPGLALLALAPGWLVLPVTAAVAAGIFGQVLVNEIITARYFSPAIRLRIYSVRFFLSFVGAATAPPLVGLLHQQTGSSAAVTLVLAPVASLTILCALAFPSVPDSLANLAPVRT